jgi:hypothetical protein
MPRARAPHAHVNSADRPSDDVLIEPLSAAGLTPNAPQKPIGRVAQGPLLVIVERVEAPELSLESIVHDFEPTTLLRRADSLFDHRTRSLEPPNDPGGRACCSGERDDRAKSIKLLCQRRVSLHQLNGMEKTAKPALLVKSREALCPEQKVEDVQDRASKVAVIHAELCELCDAAFVFFQPPLAEGPAGAFANGTAPSCTDADEGTSLRDAGISGTNHG